MTKKKKTSRASESSGILLLSTYELGRPPLGIAAPLGALRARGLDAVVADLALDPLPEAASANADFIAISTPMHTALRLGTQVALEIRRINPSAHICFHGLYAALHADYLLASGLANSVVAGDDDEALVTLAAAPRRGVHGGPGRRHRSPASFEDLGDLSRYSRLLLPDGESVLAGAVETTRGCKHVCRHCPVTPVWNGRFKAIPLDTVMADIASLVQGGGAGHISFADPDFLNGPTHARRVAEALHTAFPSVSWDFTAKVDHLLAARGRGDLKRFAELGAVFVITAVESFNDGVLDHLAKGHTRAQALDLFREAGAAAPLSLRPTFVAFTPWTTRADYEDLFDLIEELDLIGNVDPVQLTIRLLIPKGSALLAHPPTLEHLTGPYDTDSLTFPWRHPDPAMDELQESVAAAAEAGTDDPPEETFEVLRAIVFGGEPRPVSAPKPVARMSESWFCCAEPTAGQLTSISRAATAARTEASACGASSPKAVTKPI